MGLVFGHNLGLVIGLGIYVLILWVLMMLALRKGYRDWQANREIPLTEYDAVVLDKRGSIRDEMWLVFQYDGLQGEYEVGPEAFDSASVGQRGTLVLKGRAYDSFRPCVRE